MKNLFLTFMLLCTISYVTTAQEFKIPASSGKLSLLQINAVTIQNSTGQEIVIVRDQEDLDQEVIERSKGLKKLNAIGLSDNTGIGLSMQKDGGNIELRPLSRNDENRYIVKVPAGVMVYYEHSSHEAEDFIIENTSSEIEVSITYGNIKVRDASSALSLKTVYGSIDVVMKALDDKTSLLLSSAYGNVDLAIPTSSKANLKMSASWGEMFTDFDVQVKTKSEHGLDCKNCNELEGTIGGGGNLVTLKSGYGNLYLRKR